jgi:hypothetical protein
MSQANRNTRESYPKPSLRRRVFAGLGVLGLGTGAILVTPNVSANAATKARIPKIGMMGLPVASRGNTSAATAPNKTADSIVAKTATTKAARFFVSGMDGNSYEVKNNGQITSKTRAEFAKIHDNKTQGAFIGDFRLTTSYGGTLAPSERESDIPGSKIYYQPWIVKTTFDTAVVDTARNYLITSRTNNSKGISGLVEERDSLSLEGVTFIGPAGEPVKTGDFLNLNGRLPESITVSCLDDNTAKKPYLPYNFNQVIISPDTVLQTAKPAEGLSDAEKSAPMLGNDGSLRINITDPKKSEPGTSIRTKANVYDFNSPEISRDCVDDNAVYSNTFDVFSAFISAKPNIAFGPVKREAYGFILDLVNITNGNKSNLDVRFQTGSLLNNIDPSSAAN